MNGLVVWRSGREIEAVSMFLQLCILCSTLSISIATIPHVPFFLSTIL